MTQEQEHHALQQTYTNARDEADRALRDLRRRMSSRSADIYQYARHCREYLSLIAQREDSAFALLQLTNEEVLPLLDWIV